VEKDIMNTGLRSDDMSATSEGTGEPTTTNTITDEASFLALTSIPRLYYYMLLDCLVAAAYHISCDFFRRPHLYTALGSSTTAQDIARLRSLHGYDERVPSQEQRDKIYLPVFGQSGTDPTIGEGQFPCLRDQLLDAAAAFAERVFNTGEEMLRERVRTTHRVLDAYLEGMEGVSLEWSTDEAVTGVTLGLAYGILHDEGVTSVFGISTPPRAEWPFAEDANADKLIEEIFKQLLPLVNSHPAITREAISNRQRAALRGAEALATILDFSEGGPVTELDLLITRCYTWWAALRSLTGQPAAQPGLNGQPAAQPAYMT
jgi:hypothetical protein